MRAQLGNRAVLPPLDALARDVAEAFAARLGFEIGG
jgi:hypothetical protein